MLNVFAWVLFIGAVLLIFIELYAWAAFTAFTLFILLLREMNSNLCEILVELKNQRMKNDLEKQ
jgi:hypothetical protein